MSDRFPTIKFTKEHEDAIANILQYEIHSEGQNENYNNILRGHIQNGEAPRYLYVIRCLESDFYKIGITNDVDKRICQHQTGCPFTLKLIATFEADFTDYEGREISYLEKFLHQNYSSQKVRGEWYELTFEQISDIVYFLELERELGPKYDQNIEELSVFKYRFSQIPLKYK